MRVLAQGNRSSATCRFAALVAVSLLAALLGTAAMAAAAPAASAAVPGAAPPNPTSPCTWNWNRWSKPGAFSFPYTDSSFDPTQSVFSQASTALGANGWYEASSAPQFSYSGLSEGVGPGEATTGANDSEWSYGVGFYIMEPGTTQTVTIRDGGRQESHAFAFFNSAGNQFARYPRMADVSRGVHYVASEEEAKSNPVNAGGVSQGKSWSSSVSFTVPTDGVVYIHYLNYDERIRAQFASISGACGPVAVDDVSNDNVPGRPVTVDVASNDSFINRGSISIVGADSATGDLVVDGEGTWRVASGGGTISFTPEPQFTSDPKSIRYTASDGKGKGTAPARVTVGYLPVFSTRDESLANPTGETVTVDVTANDSNVNARTVSIVGGAAANGGMVDPGRGAWSVDRSTGAITFVPEPGVEGDPRPIRYTVRDVGGNVLPPVAVVVSFAPELGDDESLGNLPGDVVAIDVVENDLSFDIDPTAISIVGADEVTGSLVVKDEGTWSLGPGIGEITFTPQSSFPGDPAPISYTVADVDGNIPPPAEVVVDYLPATRDDESLGHPAGAIITIDVLENDPSNDLDPTTVAISHPNYDKASRTLTIPGEGSWSVDAATGAITVTPESGFRGEPVPINYTVTDDDGSLSTPTELAIGHSALPVTEPDESLDNEMGAAVTIDVLRNDPTSSIDPETVKIVGADPTTGELKVSREGTWAVNPITGAITFDPNARFDENPTPIEYVATDELGVSISPTSVTVTYRGVVPEVLAFAEPNDINWWSSAWRGTLTALLLAAGVVLALRGRNQPRRPSLGARSPLL